MGYNGQNSRFSSKLLYLCGIAMQAVTRHLGLLDGGLHMWYRHHNGPPTESVHVLTGIENAIIAPF